ncbi:hypothetical protein CFIMG_000124RA [Ceratocystis fimbriata CBS 114723]|uniref:Uncharacterized protein n=1 Tax=Ceratocystis fimbriata CBS 114723 TaxID=1035309 RepID=A0A2C5XFR2_9PEZI|nr:hypothetical protein CFIMG_000124RA [Ceratocystis fimbriata CBS 114723]
MQSFARAAGRRSPLLLSGSPAAGRAGLARSINCNLVAAKQQWKSLSSLPLVAGHVASKATSSPMAAGESGSAGSLRGQRNGRIPSGNKNKRMDEAQIPDRDGVRPVPSTLSPSSRGSTVLYY